MTAIKLGKVVLSSSGKANWHVGKQVFDIENGVDSAIDNICIAVDSEQRSFSNLGGVQRRFVIKPNIDNLV